MNNNIIFVGEYNEIYSKTPEKELNINLNVSQEICSVNEKFNEIMLTIQLFIFVILINWSI